MTVTNARRCATSGRSRPDRDGFRGATSDLLLTAIATARSWMNDLSEGRVNSFEAIARSENKGERHIRHLAPLGLVSPRIVEAIANGSAPADLTVSSLARALPHRWAAQEHKFGIT
jgi:site-specific DNA recombinase